MKKIIIVVFLIISYVNVAFGDEAAKNSISTGTNILFAFSPKSDSDPVGVSYGGTGFHINYERLLGEKFSIGAEIGSLFFYLLPYLEIQGRFFPWAKMFFIELDFGAMTTLMFDNGNSKDHVFTPFPYITFGFGWKIDLGKKKNWYLLPSIEEIFFLQGLFGSEVIFETNLCLKIGYKF